MAGVYVLAQASQLPLKVFIGPFLIKDILSQVIAEGSLLGQRSSDASCSMHGLRHDWLYRILLVEDAILRPATTRTSGYQ